MDARYLSWTLLIVLIHLTSAWRSSREIDRMRREPQEYREYRRGAHYQSKRHMSMPVTEPPVKKRNSLSLKPNIDGRKLSGHLSTLEDDYIENDEVVSVAIGPSPLRPKFDKVPKKQPLATPRTFDTPKPSINAVTLVKEVLTEITKDFLTRDVNENFVFGQYVGNAMRNLTKELRIKMQHDILDLIVKYQKINSGEKKEENKPVDVKSKDKGRNATTDGGDETWPDFTNLTGIA